MLAEDASAECGFRSDTVNRSNGSEGRVSVIADNLDRWMKEHIAPILTTIEIAARKLNSAQECRFFSGKRKSCQRGMRKDYADIFGKEMGDSRGAREKSPRDSRTL